MHQEFPLSCAKWKISKNEWLSILAQKLLEIQEDGNSSIFIRVENPFGFFY